MAKSNKQAKGNGKSPDKPHVSHAERLAKMFDASIKSLSIPGNPEPVVKPFSKDNQPKRRGRPKGLPNNFTREIKKAAIDALIQYGVDGTGKGGLQGYFYRCADL